GAYAIMGGLVVPENALGVWVLDSILDGAGAHCLSGPIAGSPAVFTHGAPLTTERSTFFGQVLVKTLHASEGIFTAIADAQRTQDGCVRFSYVHEGSHVPRRFRCQPDLQIEQDIADAQKLNPSLTAAERAKITSFVQGWLVPSFTTDRYGSPFYGQ